jgi:ABC-2 type transport system permease protein
MRGFGALLGKELREQVRTYRLPVVAIVFLLFGILSPVTDRYMKQLIDAIGTQAGGFSITLPPPSLAGAMNQLVKNLSQFGTICALLLAMGSVATEKERGTAGLILTKPASRAAFLAAKLVAIAVNLAVAVGLGCAVAFVYTWLLYDETFPPGGFIAMALLLWLSLVVFAALTMLGSTVTRSALAAAGVGLVALVLVGIIGALPAIGPYMPTSLIGPGAALALGLDGGNLTGPIVFNVALVVGLWLLSWLVFRRQEI